MPVWCQDEAGPYQAIPQPGANGQPEERPARQPHEYIRGGTATLLTLCHPATGTVRVKGVTSAPNVVLHPWLQTDLEDILKTLPSSPPPLPADHPLLQYGRHWLGRPADAPLPPVRLILIWDNLVGHTSADLLRWLAHHGVLPLYTPLSGSWLNLAESMQRISVRRALAGQEPATPDDLIAWLEDTAAGWNEEPTPFVWDGKRRERRRRARARRLGGSAAVVDQFHVNAA